MTDIRGTAPQRVRSRFDRHAGDLEPMRPGMFEPLRIPQGFWQRPDVLTALDERDVGSLFRLVRQRTGASQTRIGIAVGMPQSQVSVIMSTGPKRRQVTSLDVMARIADGLDLPHQARRRLGLAAVIAAADGDTKDRSVLSDGTEVDTDPTEEARSEEPVRRRKLLGAAGAAIADAAFGLSTPGARHLDAFADALTRYAVLRTPSQPVSDLATLRDSVASAKRAYQACRYTVVAAELPALLIALQEAVASARNDERLQQLHVLSADGYHVAASVLLKLDDHGLASLAADRSMRAAELSQEPLALGASARILVHTMMDGGHLRRATQLASDLAARLDPASGSTGPAAVSVYGALLLRGAVAAAYDEDRTATLTLADEAEQAARRLGADGNHYWTAFGPTNVLLHRVSFAATLGDAGTAIDYARRVDLSKIDVIERRAALYVDVARAFNQWGKYDKALNAIKQAESIAPEEIRSRPAVHRLVADLAIRAPRSLRSEIRQYADHIGASA